MMAQLNPPIPYWKNSVMQIAAGGTAGFTEICIMHPLDVVKTRIQFQSAGSAAAYTSVADVLRKTIRNEGFFAIYKGILPPMLVETPKRATKFFTFEQYKSLFSFSSLPASVTFSMAGLCSGLTEAFIVNPFEAVKVRLQTDQAKFSNQKGSFHVAKTIYNEGGFGLNGLNRGLTSTLYRHGVWNMVYFGLYHNFKMYLPKTENKAFSLGYRVLLGFVAGTLASIANIPFDVAKSRIQGHLPSSGPRKYNSCFQTILLIKKEEGARALYKGLVPKLMRLGPGGAIMIIAYEEIYKILRSNFS